MGSHSDHDGYCSGLVPSSTFPGTHIDSFAFIGASLYLLMALITLSFIQYGKYAALRAGEEGGRVTSILFPTFEYLLYIQAAISVYTAIVIILVPIDPGEVNRDTQSLLFASVWSFQHGVIEGLALLLQQNGCGHNALKKSLLMILLWCGICFILYVSFFKGGKNYFVGQLLIDLILLVYYGSLTFLPQRILHRRPSLLLYSKYWLRFRIAGTLLHIGFLTAGHRVCSCGYYFFRIVLFCFFQPILSYEVLLLDTEWWQGLSPNPIVTAAHADLEDLANEFSLASAQTLAEVMDQLNNLEGLLFLNYNSLTFHSHSLLGKGSFSQVVKGSYRHTPVAIKTIYTQDLTVDIIHKIAAETKILSLLRQSPHVVFIHGLVLSPPSIFIVLELCQFGSLNNVLRGYEMTPAPGVFTGSSSPSPSSSTPLYSTSIMRTQTRSFLPPLVLTIPDMLFLALGAAKGVHAIHSFSQFLCHRDIKSFNFLVSAEMIVKIADLELGDHQDTTTTTRETTTPANYCPSSCFGKRSDSNSLNTSLLSPQGDGSPPQETDRDPPPLSSPMRIHPSVLLMQATWLAPEVLPTGVFTQASDIYSLALVLWEIRTKRYPYSHCNFMQTQIRNCILSGYREPFPVIPEHDLYEQILQEFDEIVELSWDQNPENRLRSHEIVRRLGRLVETCAVESLKSVHRNQRKHERRMADGARSSRGTLVGIGVGVGSDLLDASSRDGPEPESEWEPEPEDQPTSPSIAPVPATLSVYQLHQLLESHGGEWIVVSSSSPHHLLHVTAAWKRSFLKLIPAATAASSGNNQRAVFQEQCRNGITLLNFLHFLTTAVPSSVSSLLSSALITGYGHCLLTTSGRDRSSSRSMLPPPQTLALHGYRFSADTLAEIYHVVPSRVTPPFVSIAILFSNLTPASGCRDEAAASRAQSRASRRLTGGAVQDDRHWRADRDSPAATSRSSRLLSFDSISFSDSRGRSSTGLPPCGANDA
jgi:serine/threonine protein kinase